MLFRRADFSFSGFCGCLPSSCFFLFTPGMESQFAILSSNLHIGHDAMFAFLFLSRFDCLFSLFLQIKLDCTRAFWGYTSIKWQQANLSYTGPTGPVCSSLPLWSSVSIAVLVRSFYHSAAFVGGIKCTIRNLYSFLYSSRHNGVCWRKKGQYLTVCAWSYSHVSFGFPG
jgi:hypothetical protein